LKEVSLKKILKEVETPLACVPQVYTHPLTHQLRCTCKPNWFEKAPLQNKGALWFLKFSQTIIYEILYWSFRL